MLLEILSETPFRKPLYKKVNKCMEQEGVIVPAISTFPFINELF